MRKSRYSLGGHVVTQHIDADMMVSDSCILYFNDESIVVWIHEEMGELQKSKVRF
jgi:hypothetical protein